MRRSKTRPPETAGTTPVYGMGYLPVPCGGDVESVNYLTPKPRIWSIVTGALLVVRVISISTHTIFDYAVKRGITWNGYS
jgi:hypothetical protein